MRSEKPTCSSCSYAALLPPALDLEVRRRNDVEKAHLQLQLPHYACPGQHSSAQSISGRGNKLGKSTCNCRPHVTLISPNSSRGRQIRWRNEVEKAHLQLQLPLQLPLYACPESHSSAESLKQLERLGRKSPSVAAAIILYSRYACARAAYDYEGQVHNDREGKHKGRDYSLRSGKFEGTHKGRNDILRFGRLEGKQKERVYTLKPDMFEGKHKGIDKIFRSRRFGGIHKGKSYILSWRKMGRLGSWPNKVQHCVHLERDKRTEMLFPYRELLAACKTDSANIDIGMMQLQKS